MERNVSKCHVAKFRGFLGDQRLFIMKNSNQRLTYCMVPSVFFIYTVLEEVYCIKISWTRKIHFGKQNVVFSKYLQYDPMDVTTNRRSWARLEAFASRFALTHQHVNDANVNTDFFQNNSLSSEVTSQNN